MKDETIYLEDGYTGHKLRFYVDPVVYDSDLVCLRCAEQGMEHTLAWHFRKDWRKAILDALSAEAQALGLYD